MRKEISIFANWQQRLLVHKRIQLIHIMGILENWTLLQHVEKKGLGRDVSSKQTQVVNYIIRKVYNLLNIFETFISTMYA